MLKTFLNLYNSGRITKAGVAEAVVKGIITANDYTRITGESYPEK